MTIIILQSTIGYANEVEYTLNFALLKMLKNDVRINIQLFAYKLLSEEIVNNVVYESSLLFTVFNIVKDIVNNLLLTV
jgi:hypothetical protein